MALQGAQAKAEAFQRFQLRALSLLEIWLKKMPRNPSVVLLPVPMLRALRVASRSRSHQALTKRLMHVLKNQVAAAKPAFSESLQIPGVSNGVHGFEKMEVGVLLCAANLSCCLCDLGISSDTSCPRS